MTINDAVEITLNGINPEWSDLEKIRYVYVTIGGLTSTTTKVIGITLLILCSILTAL